MTRLVSRVSVVLVSASILTGPLLTSAEALNDKEIATDAGSVAITEARVPTDREAGYVAALAYVRALTNGEIQILPTALRVGRDIEGFSKASDRLWEVRFVIPDERLTATILVNAETGDTRIVCGANSIAPVGCPYSDDSPTRSHDDETTNRR